MRHAFALLLVVPALAGAQSLEALHSQAGRAFDGLQPPAAAKAAAAPRAQPAPLSLSDLARAIQNDPTAIDDLLNILVAKAGPLGRELDTPARRAQIKEALRTAEPSILDRFPTLTTNELAAAGEAYAAKLGPVKDPARGPELVLVLPGSPVDPPKDAFLKPLGHGLLYGDQTLFNSGAPWADSKAVADALNYLSANAGELADGSSRYGSLSAWLGALLAEGHTLEVKDARYYANFGDLRLDTPAGRRDVATPTLLDTGITLPSGRKLIVPVAHSEFDIAIDGPRVHARMSWFFGIDGRASFRADDTDNQGWVGGRAVRTWNGAEAASVLDRAAWVSRELAAKVRASGLPAGGYGSLGDCNDAQAMVTGVAPLGMLRDPGLYNGGGALDAASRALPYDRTQPIDPRRVWDSRPFENVDEIPMPEVRAAMAELKATLGIR